MDTTELAGTWSLARAIEYLADGTYRTAAVDEGYLTYGPEGTVFAILDSRARGQRDTAAADGSGRAVPAATIWELSTEEKVRAVEGFAAYAGTYSLDGDVVTHHVRFSLNPALKGRDIRRSARFEDGCLLISTRNLGSPRVLDLVWERVDAPSVSGR